MSRPRPFLLALIFLAAADLAFAQQARDTVVEVSATAQELPAQIVLSWLSSGRAITSQKVFRREKGATQWLEIADLPGNATTYPDGAVGAGVAYEYAVTRRFTSGTPLEASGYLSAGIQLPLVEDRGRLILLVDDTMAVPLAGELARFVDDLTGDGWLVARQEVPRNAAVTAVKQTILNLHAADPANTRALLLFGRIPVPYSGNIAPDGHGDHIGAWPADVYYGDLDGVWTDTTVNNSGASRQANRNIPGDGKFDQSLIPTPVDLEVGRIDLANMQGVSGGLSETGLLRQYLERDHQFRHKMGAFATIPRRGLIDDHFGYFSGEAFAATGWRNFTAFFGSAPGSIVAQDWFSTLQSESYLWAYGCGPGSYTSASGVGSSSDFASNNSLAVYNVLFGSYHGDWDNTNNFLRAPLAGLPDSLGLVSFWAGRPHWHLYPMAMGETVGYGARLTQNNLNFSQGGYVSGAGARSVHIALMGDPTLRLHPVSPITDLSADSSSGAAALTWSSSPEEDIWGYYIYRADSPDAPFVRLGGALTTSSSYVDRTGSPGRTYRYMVRAVKLESSAGGTYLNSSQGIYVDGSFPALIPPLYQRDGSYFLDYRGQQEKYLGASVSVNGYNDLDGYWYYLLPNGDLYEFTPPYSSPALTGVLVARLGPVFYEHPNLLAFQFHQRDGSYFTDYRGQQEKYLGGTASAFGYEEADGYWYYLLPDGGLYEFAPPYSESALTGVLINQLGPEFYDDPALLTTAGVAIPSGR